MNKTKNFVALSMASLRVSRKVEALLSVPANHGGDQREKTRRVQSVQQTTELGRRGLIFSVMVVSSTTLSAQANDSRTALLQKYLKKSEENKVKNDKERQEDFYKRNYKDYFKFIQGGLEGKKEEQLTESEKGILEWLKTHK